MAKNTVTRTKKRKTKHTKTVPLPGHKHLKIIVDEDFCVYIQITDSKTRKKTKWKILKPGTLECLI